MMSHLTKVMNRKAPPSLTAVMTSLCTPRCTGEEAHTSTIITPGDGGGGRTRKRVPATMELIEVATDNRPSVPYLVSTH